MIDKDIERCKELIKEEHSNWIGLTNQEALENVLKELEMKQKDIEAWRDYNLGQEEHITELNNKICDLEFKVENKDKELEIYEKIAEKLAEIMVYLPINEEGTFYDTKEAIID